MTIRSTAYEWPSVLRRLAAGNQRFAAGEPFPDGKERGERVMAAVAFPETGPVPPERLFDVSAAELYVIRTNLTTISLDLLAGLEWAAAQGVRVGVIFGGAELCDRLEVLLAPQGMKIVEAVLGPNDRVRFLPRGVGANAQILKSR